VYIQIPLVFLFLIELFILHIFYFKICFFKRGFSSCVLYKIKFTR